MTWFSGLACGRCDAPHDRHRIQRTCTACGGPLLAQYDFDRVAPSLADVLARRPGQNRLFELSPLSGGIEAPTLGEGATPLVPVPRLGAALGANRLFVKDEAQNPTASFKARGMAAAMGRAKELGIEAVCLPSAGNAGGAAAAYGAMHGIEVHVYVPKSTPAPIVAETRALGANVTLIDGTIADAGHALAPVAEENGWFPLSTLREPYRIEGKKVMGFELLYDLGVLPDAVVYPTGGGTGLIGMYKAFDEMERLGWIDSRRPKMISVQTAGCAPIVRAFEQGLESAPPWEAPDLTAAFGLRVPGALGDFLILRAVRESNGTAIAIAEEDLLAGAQDMARLSGLQGAAESGACVAAVRQLIGNGFLGADETIVIFGTGHALKYG